MYFHCSNGLHAYHLINENMYKYNAYTLSFEQSVATNIPEHEHPFTCICKKMRSFGFRMIRIPCPWNVITFFVSITQCPLSFVWFFSTIWYKQVASRCALSTGKIQDSTMQAHLRAFNTLQKSWVVAILSIIRLFSKILPVGMKILSKWPNGQTFSVLLVLVRTKI